MALAVYKEHNLCCIICSGELEKPKSLPCCHGFCRTCLHSYIMSKPTVCIKDIHGFYCPICRQFAAAPKQTSSREQWADDFITDFRFVGMLASLPKDMSPPACSPSLSLSSVPDDEAAVRRPAACTCHKKPLPVFCHTHACDICEECARDVHGICVTKSTNTVTTEYSQIVNQLDGLIQAFEKLKNTSNHRYGREYKTGKKRLKRDIVQSPLVQDGVRKEDIGRSIDRITSIYQTCIDNRRLDYHNIIEDARDQIGQARLIAQSADIDLLRISVFVLQSIHKKLQGRLEEFDTRPNPVLFLARTRAYVSCAFSQLAKTVRTYSSLEMERKSDNIRHGFVLRIQESFNAKLDSDTHNCLITGAVILSDGRIVLADAHNSNIKLYSSTFAHVNAIDVEVAPFDLTETECFNIAVTFGKKGVIHFYEVRDVLPLNHKYVSTEQPCYGISSGNDLVFVYCGNSWLTPACVRIYDYNQVLVSRVSTDLFSSGEYLGYCPISERIYVTSQVGLSNQTLDCFSGDLDRISRSFVHVTGTGDGTNIGVARGMVAVKHGVLLAVRNNKINLGIVFPRSTIMLADFRNMKENLVQGHMDVLLTTDETEFARTLASNKQRTLLLVAQQTPFFMDRKNNQVKLYRIENR